MADSHGNPYRSVSGHVVPKFPKTLPQFQYRKDNRRGCRFSQWSVNTLESGTRKLVKPAHPVDNIRQFSASHLSLDRTVFSQYYRSPSRMTVKRPSQYKFIRTSLETPAYQSRLVHMTEHCSTPLCSIEKSVKLLPTTDPSAFKYVEQRWDRSAIWMSCQRESVTGTCPKVKERRSYRSRYKLVHRSRNDNDKVLQNTRTVQSGRLKIVTRFAIRTVFSGTSQSKRIFRLSK